MKQTTRPIKDRMNIAYTNLKAEEYIASNPIKVVREMAEKPNATIADIEICAMWTAAVVWGDNKGAVKYATRLMELCEWNPAEYVKLGEFYDLSDDMTVCRAIKGKQFKEANHSLRMTYNKVSSVADYARQHKQTVSDLMVDLSQSLAPFNFGTPAKNAACKRTNLLLRWMVRKDDIDLGIWGTQWANKSDLFAVLDKKAALTAERLGFITHSRSSWLSVLELTETYKSWNRVDPLKYDLVFSSEIF